MRRTRPIPLQDHQAASHPDEGRPGRVNISPTTSPSDQDRPRRFGDRFRATRVLKSGSGGETLRGIDASDGREVVIRTLVDADPTTADRFQREMEGFAAVEGTDVVRPVAAGRQGSVLYVVLPHVPGITLEAHLAGRSEPLTVAEALAVGRGILMPLA